MKDSNPIRKKVLARIRQLHVPQSSIPQQFFTDVLAGGVMLIVIDWDKGCDVCKNPHRQSLLFCTPTEKPLEELFKQ